LIYPAHEHITHEISIEKVLVQRQYPEELLLLGIAGIDHAGLDPKLKTSGAPRAAGGEPVPYAKNFALATPAREKAMSEGDSGGEDHCGQHCRYEDGQARRLMSRSASPRSGRSIGPAEPRRFPAP